jgi:hypothetical protein
VLAEGVAFVEALVADGDEAAVADAESRAPELLRAAAARAVRRLLG